MTPLFRRRSRWAGIDFLSLRPAQCVDYFVDDNDGQVVLRLPRFRSGPLSRWLQPKLRPERAHVRVRLEERGSWLWMHLDGKRTVADLVTEFRQHFPGDFEQIDHRVCQYLYQLADNGCIRFVNLPTPES
jgi:hypothetical protein